MPNLYPDTKHMVSWQYKIILLPASHQTEALERFDAKITAAGLEGWEAVSMNETRVLLKRRIV